MATATGSQGCVDRQAKVSTEKKRKEKKKEFTVSSASIQCRRWFRNRVTLLIIYWNTGAYGLVALITVAMQHRDFHFFCHILKTLCAQSMDKQGKTVFAIYLPCSLQVLAEHRHPSSSGMSCPRCAFPHKSLS